ncbi:hypothetical protein PAXRUDRAFT_829357 [Paxillus rubicundulus Ve08.2h10]|uniref:Uncharacterized protein n=1 Tax=Paxillus rubicundulus Ve08.2h10 TaxID=930991 RepID=A0A0D0DMX5_9AGAM|nr:hypothetical protein PAXRUDRAFT_829357 [Paxillus rubicundulus Ve08.2h10]
MPPMEKELVMIFFTTDEEVLNFDLKSGSCRIQQVKLQYWSIPLRITHRYSPAQNAANQTRHNEPVTSRSFSQ